MAKQYKDYDRSLVESGEWLKLVRSFKSGVYEVAVPNYSALRSLQVTISKVNSDPECKYIFSTSSNYNRLEVRIEVDLKKPAK